MVAIWKQFFWTEKSYSYQIDEENLIAFVVLTSCQLNVSFSWNWIIKSKNSFSFSTLFKQPLNKIKEGFMLTMKIYSKWCFCCFAWILIGMHYWQVICLYTSFWALNVTKVILKNHHSSSCIAGSKLLIGCDDFYASIQAT